MIELARVRRISITTEEFYVATKLATIESSTAHDRAGCAKAGTHDRVRQSVVPCCVVIEEVMCMRATYQAWARDNSALGTHTIRLGRTATAYGTQAQHGLGAYKTKTCARQWNSVATKISLSQQT